MSIIRGRSRNFGKCGGGGAQPGTFEGGGGAAALVSAESAKPRVSQYTEKRYSADMGGGGGAPRTPSPLNPPLIRIRRHSL